MNAARARRPRPPRSHLRGILLLASAAVLSLWSARVQAQSLPSRRTGIVSLQHELLISVGVQDLFGPDERKRLTSGFASRVLIRVALHREGVELPILVAFQRAEIVYDLWDERFQVRTTRGAGPDEVSEAASADDAIFKAATLWQFPLIPIDELQPGAHYYLVLRADLNPISEETLADLKRWLTAANDSGRPAGVEGIPRSFVSVFLNPRLEDSERQLRFVSQVWERPTP